MGFAVMADAANHGARRCALAPESNEWVHGPPQASATRRRSIGWLNRERPTDTWAGLGEDDEGDLAWLANLKSLQTRLRGWSGIAERARRSGKKGRRVT